MPEMPKFGLKTGGDEWKDTSQIDTQKLMLCTVPGLLLVLPDLFIVLEYVS